MNQTFSQRATLSDKQEKTLAQIEAKVFGSDDDE